MAEDRIELKGADKPISEKEKEKFIKEIKLSRKQTREDSKVDVKLLKAEFNF